MTTKTYLRRAAKYLIYITIFISIGFTIFGLISQESVINIELLLNSPRGLLLIAMLLVFSLLQPLWAYNKETLNFDATKVSDKVCEVLEISGYELTHKSEGEPGEGLLIFRYRNAARRIIGGYATDGIKITTVNGVSVISGARRDISPVSTRLRGMIK